MTETMVLLIDDSQGIYVPKSFATRYTLSQWGVSLEDCEILLSGPEHEYYWDTWEGVLADARYTDYEGVKWTLYQDGDLFAVSEHHKWEDQDD